MNKAAFALSAPSTATPISGAEDSWRPEGHSSEDDSQSVSVMGESDSKSRPVGSILSGTGGGGEGDDGMSRPLEGVRLTAVRSAAIASGEAFDPGGVDAEGSGLQKYLGLGEVSAIPCVAQVMTGFGEVADMRRPSAVV